MRFFNNIRCIAAVMALSVTATGCSIPFLNKSGRVSPDKVYDACVAYDAEDYDDLSEMTEDLDNKRVLLSGMFISAEGKDIRHAMNNDDINTAFSDISEELIYNLYSKKIDKLTLMLKAEEKKDSSVTKMVVVSAQFDSEDEAWKYYKNCNDMFAEMMEPEGFESQKDYLTDDKLECTVTQIFQRRSAASYSVYIDGTSVMVLTGYESRCNRADLELDDFCSLLDIPSPDMSVWDCTAQYEVSDRLLLYAEEYSYDLMDYEDFKRSTNILSSQVGGFYTEVDDVSDMEDLLEFDDFPLNNCTMMRAAYNEEDEESIVYILSYTFVDSHHADEFYEVAVDYVLEEVEDDITSNNTSTSGGITYTKIVANSYACIDYGVYLDGDIVYMIGVMADDSSGADLKFNDCIRIMELP